MLMLYIYILSFIELINVSALMLPSKNSLFESGSSVKLTFTSLIFPKTNSVFEAGSVKKFSATFLIFLSLIIV